MAQQTATYIQNDAFAKSLGIKLLDEGENTVRCVLEIREEHKNGLGTIHGAVIFALGDIAFAAACNTQQVSIGMQADIRYLNKPKSERLLTKAQLISGSKKIAHYEVIISDDVGTKVAVFTGTAYRLPNR
ncbi:thioesterase domain protein [Oleiphilus messinensis]|uniref:Thioesterase domain protein n=1 Tax=Oleiphilus messinensis TaxID=141451 RepID=A0A1Y0IA52_9GAMM|nr:PaaI family thioesterase [Oleiphilus messinensis]ARU57397.1 thioesterase domain protein [Oleiphilus messinensis]